jgi:glutathione S-transferase
VSSPPPQSAGRPERVRLWHIPVSHYNEKVRWALDLKGVAHDRRALLPPSHMAVSFALTRGAAYTVPVLQMDGRAIADSTAIIAALEEAVPEPALYPADPTARRRALALEDHFDEQVGPYSRLLAFHELRKEPERLADFAGTILPAPLGRSALARRVGGAAASAFTGVRYRVAADEAAENARAKLLAGLDRLEAELEAGDGEYLVGDSFTVADLTAACMFAPLVGPAKGPELPEPPPAYEEFRAGVAERPGYRWVEQTFERHRGASPRRP